MELKTREAWDGAMDKNRYLIQLSESEQSEFGRVDFAEQSEAQKIFSAVWELESQVNDGGFDQLFRYGDIDAIAHAALALRTIGASACARIVERAIEVIAPLGAMSEARSPTLEALNTLDSEFFAYPDNLTELLFEYVSRHPQAFGPVPPEEAT